jgi:fructose-1,6-bisphosphatase/inositol monophosphatase family enzyme
MDNKKRAFDCPKTRIYTLAGNPMMVNLIEGRVDAVVEGVGQKCHDVVPGFVIALRAGAILRDLSNRPITEAELAQSLRNPQSSFSYVLACNETLAAEIVELLREV